MRASHDRWALGRSRSAIGPRGQPRGNVGLTTVAPVTEEASLIVPFSVNDFIDRAVQVYGDRIGAVDEPDQPARPLGDAEGGLTYAEIGALARRQAA
eukprot:gene39061-44284_t